MGTRHVVVLAVLWSSSILGVGLWAQGGAGANRQPTPPQPETQVQRPGDVGPVLTGSDLGFQRVAPTGFDANGRVPGYFVVKLDGKWVPVSQIPVATWVR
jgi:hypothetical protein